MKSAARKRLAHSDSSLPVANLLMLVLLISTGCVSTAGHWKLDLGWDSAVAQGEESGVLPSSFDAQVNRAKKQHALATDANSLADAIDGLQSLLDQQPDNTVLQVELAEALVLFGAGYETRRGEKRSRFQTAQKHAESALLSNPAFRAALVAGQRPGQAASKLEISDLPAMVIWATATAYLFDEGMTRLGRLRHFRGLEDLRLMMERAMALAPEHEYGLVPFSLAIFHIAAPPIVGGDRERAAELIEQAIATPGISLLPRWGRARYLHPLTGNREALIEDLEWVLSQDPAAVDSPYRWNVFVQRDSQRMLERLK